MPSVQTMIKNRHGHTLDVLGFAVVSGRYQPGQAVPPEPLLCDEYGVSRWWPRGWSAPGRKWARGF
jgi:DNA-binding FadR family transcriptional regulator